MGRRRRKRFSARAPTQPPRLPEAAIADGAAEDPNAGPVGPSSPAPKRQKRTPSYPPNDDKKRRKFNRAQDDVTSETNEQEENRNDSTHDDVIHRRPDCPAASAGEGERGGGEGSHDEIPILVTCNRNDGWLYLSKLRVVVNERCRKKCIRTGSAWWTPNEFQVVSGRGAAKDWKRTVKHSGQRLKALLTSGVLCLEATPPKCLCRPCCQLTEQGRKTDSPEERRECVDDVGTASEATDVVDDVKRGSKAEEGVKRPGLRMIRIHRRGKRHVNDTVDRKSGPPHALPVKRKSRKSESNSSVASRDGRSRGRPRKSLVFRLSSASFEAVVCHPDGATESGANRPPTAPEEAFEGRCSDRDASEEAVPNEALDQTKPADDIPPSEHPTCKSLSDDVIDDVTESFRREDSGAEISSSRETKTEGCLITGNDESVSSSVTSFCCEKIVAKEPEVHASTRSPAHAQSKSSAMVDIPEASSDASSSADVSSGGSGPDRNAVTDRKNDVTVADVTSSPSAPRRKSAHLDAVIAELKRKKRSTEGSVPASSAFASSVPVSGGGGGGRTEGQRPVAAGTSLKAKLPTTTCSDLTKMEMKMKTSSEASASSSGLRPSFEASADVKPICLNPIRTGSRTQDSAVESKAGLRRTAKESSEGKWKTAASSCAPPADPPAGWRKDEGSSGSEVGRSFWMSSGGMTSADLMTSSSTLNISQLASMYGLNASSPMTSFPFPPTQPSFPFFPPYLFMGFPLQPLLPPPHFASSSSSSGVPTSGLEASLPVPAAPVSTAISGSAPQHRKRRTQQQQSHKNPLSSSKESKAFPQLFSSSSSSSAGTSSALSPHFSPSDLHLWRRLASDFSAHAWATGSALAATGSGKSQTGSTARHPIWRPAAVASSPQSAASRERVETTIAAPQHRPFAHAQRQAGVTSEAGRGNRKASSSSVLVDFTRKLCSEDKTSEEADGFGGISGASGTGKYSSSDCEGVLDLSKK